MNKGTALFFGMLAVSTSLQAGDRSVTLNGEYGCDDPTTQRSRAVLLQNIMSDNPHYVAQRAEMRESLINISQSMCQPLNGKFKVLKKKDGYTQVKTESGSLWITD